MRAFLMCAVLTVAALTVGTTSLQAQEYYHGRYYYVPRPVVVVRSAPIVVGSAPVIATPAPAPLIVTQPAVVAPAYAPGPVIVQPVFRPFISLRFGR
jgi:hypothetical protein